MRVAETTTASVDEALSLARPMVYDIALDEMRPVTQADVDMWMSIIGAMTHTPTPEPIATTREEFASARLAVYPNRFRENEAFVAEEGPIKPYSGVRGLSGECLYPSIPNTGRRLSASMPIAFARELAARWNKAGSQ